MAKAIQLKNTTEWNPVLASIMKRSLSPKIQASVDYILQEKQDSLILEKTINNSPLIVKYQPTNDEMKELSVSIISPDTVASEIPTTLDQLYIPGPQGESFLFWGSQHIALIADPIDSKDNIYVYLSVLKVPEGEIVYHVVESGKIADVRRFQCINTLDQEVTISFLIGIDPFLNPRLRTDIIIPALNEYDLSCSTDATEGEKLAMIASAGNAIQVAISGHITDV
jgi:hypothetical protein